jgi:hypothetical protein
MSPKKFSFSSKSKLTKIHSRGFGCLWVPILAIFWIVGVWSLERWGGTICVSNLAYISREDVFLVHSDRVLYSNDRLQKYQSYNNQSDPPSGDVQRDFNRIPPFDRLRAKKFYRDNAERFDLVRLMAIRRPDQYWRAFFFPFTRQVDIRSYKIDNPRYNDMIDTMTRGTGSRPMPACRIEKRLRNK